MVFSSLAFLYLFLPCALLGHLCIPHRFRLVWLLTCSLFFYAWGEGLMVLVLIGSILWNYCAGRWIQRLADRPDQRRISFVIAILVNLVPLIFCKYSEFLLQVLLVPIHGFHGECTTILTRTPIGISFFTFQAISYLVDIYRSDIVAERSLIAFGAYKSLFPQLIAGPIVRYRDVVDGLRTQQVAIGEKAAGLERFVIGLAKKVLIADALAGPADRIFNLDPDHLTTPLAWVGILAYTLQIYFDFSGYSDMAIGIGRILGFHIPENFNLPYTATSIRDFWRRWHISLSSWFRDYVYFPMGGSRGGSFRTVINLCTVFLLCGLWHGANWTFLFWGAAHGLFLGFEHYGLLKLGPRLGRCYAIVVIVLTWVLFRAPSLHQAMHYYGALLGYGAVGGTTDWQETMGGDTLLPFAVGVFLAVGGWSWLGVKVEKMGTTRIPHSSSLAGTARIGRSWAFLFLCTIMLLGHAYSPFIYFRF
jgi:alginate O-acetyltransferase complex protein AlgI